MTRSEFELELVERLEDIRALYKQYNPEAFETPEGVYLSIGITNAGISANNRYFNHSDSNPDYKHPVAVFRTQGGKNVQY